MTLQIRLSGSFELTGTSGEKIIQIDALPLHINKNIKVVELDTCICMLYVTDATKTLTTKVARFPIVTLGYGETHSMGRSLVIARYIKDSAAFWGPGPAIDEGLYLKRFDPFPIVDGMYCNIEYIGASTTGTFLFYEFFLTLRETTLSEAQIQDIVAFS